MRIAFITGRLSERASGVKVVAERLSATLAEKRHEVVVFGQADDAWSVSDSAKWTGATPRVFRSFGPKSFGYLPRLKKAIQEFSPDIIHTHGIWSFGSIVANQMIDEGVPSVVSPHGMLDAWAMRQSSAKKQIAGWLFQNEHLRRAAAIHALTDQEANTVRAAVANTVVTIPNGVDIPTSRSDTAAPEWRKRVPEDATISLYLGRIHPKKNISSLIRAFEQVEEQSLHLVIAGTDQDGHQAELKGLADRLDLNKRVTFVGPQFGEEKTRSLGTADCFVLPSLSEGLPMAVLEAWAAGCPVLMSPECNLTGAFANGAALDCGCNANSIKLALKQFSNMDKRARHSLAKKGREIVLENYTWPAIAKEFIALYERCLIRPEHKSLKRCIK